MTNPNCEEECLAEMYGWIAMFKTENEFDSGQGGYPSILEGSCFIHEGRRVVPEIHGDDLPEQLYQLDGCFALEFEEG